MLSQVRDSLPTEEELKGKPKALANPQERMLQVMAWDIGEQEPYLITQCYDYKIADRVARNTLLYDRAEYTGIKDLTKDFPYWEKIYMVKDGIVQESEIE